MLVLTKKIIKKLPRFILGFLIAVFIVTSHLILSDFVLKDHRVYAAFNKQINYQGKLTDSSNVAVADGTYHMKFWLLTSPTAATTTALWAEDRSTAPGDRVTVSNGLFSVMLGSSTPLTSVDFNQTLYLGVEIGGSAGAHAFDGEMTPRKKLGAVPAAFTSDYLDGLSSEQFLRNDAVNSTSTATTWLTFTQNGAGNIANFVGPSSAPVFSILSSGEVSVGTSSPSGRFTVWGAGTGTGVLANFVNSASTTVMRILDNGNVGIGTTSPYAALSVVGQAVASYFTATSTTATSSFAYDLSVAGRLSVLQSGTNATIVGDTSGDTRGVFSVDIQSGRSVVTQVSSGAASMAIGYRNTASASNSSASGYNNTATGISGSAFGSTNTASASYASALGYINTASAENASAIGSSNSATGAASSAFGYTNSASGAYSSAFGDENFTYSDNSSAFGQGNIVSGTNSSVFGYHNKAFTLNSAVAGNQNFTSTGGLASVAFGVMNNQTGGTLNTTTGAITGTATGTATVGRLSSAFGILNTVSGNFGQAFGFNNTISTDGSSAFGSFITNSVASSTQIGSGDDAKIVIRGDDGFEGFVGIGTSSPYAALSVVGQAVASYFTATSTTATSSFAYDVSVTGRLKVIQSGTSAVIIGDTTGNARGTNATDVQSSRLTASQVASGNQSTAFGYRNTASALESISIGAYNTASAPGDLLSPVAPIAIGYSNTASNYQATAIGNSNTSSGLQSVAIGNSNTSSGTQGSAFGYTNTASGQTSSAFGFTNIASGLNASVFGNNNKGFTLNSVLVGNRNFTSSGGLASVAIGVMNNQTGGTLNTTTGAITGTATGTATVGALSSAVGISNTVSADFGQAFGYNNTVSGLNALAYGFGNTVSVTGSSAFGSFITNSTASSTQIGPGDSSKLIIRGDTGFAGFVGIGSTTPYAKLSIINNSNSLPQLFVGTSTTAGVSPLLFVGATTTGPMDWARVGIGTGVDPSGGAGLRDQLVVSGRIYSTWREMRCDVPGANLTVLTQFDTMHWCGDFIVDIDTEGRIDPVASPTPVPYVSLTAGFSGAASGEGVSVRAGQKVVTLTNNPVMEAMVSISSAQANTLNIVGFYNSDYGADTATMPTDGAFFIATSTNNWIALTRNASTDNYIDTGVATSTSFQKLRVETSTDKVIFLIDGDVVGESTASLPTVNLSPALVVAITSTTGTARTLNMSYVRVWVDDPPGGGPLFAVGPRGPEPDFNFADYNPVSGAEISSAYLAQDAINFLPGTLVSLRDEGGPIVEVTQSQYDKNLFGVVSTETQQVYGNENNSTIRVAVTGRVPVIVSSENGPVLPGDYLTSSSVPGAAMKAIGSGHVIGRAIDTYSDTGTSTILMTIEPSYYSGNVLLTDANGNVGVGTSSPLYKLNVSGDVGAKGFAITGALTGMRNITAITPETSSTYLESIRNINISTYRYSTDSATTTRLGIISTEAPQEILTASGDVDLYKLAIFTLAGVKAQQLKVDDLETRVSAIELSIEEGGGGFSFDSILNNFGRLGVKISNGIAQFRNLIVERLVVGTPEKPSGITLYDEVTGRPYCVKVSSGKLKNIPGECEALPPETDPDNDHETGSEDGSGNGPGTEAVPHATSTPAESKDVPVDPTETVPDGEPLPSVENPDAPGVPASDEASDEEGSSESEPEAGGTESSGSESGEDDGGGNEPEASSDSSGGEADSGSGEGTASE